MNKYGKILSELRRIGKIYEDPCPFRNQSMGLMSGIAGKFREQLSNSLRVVVFLVDKKTISEEALNKLDYKGIKAIASDIKDLKWLNHELNNNPDEFATKYKEFYILIR